MYPNICHLSTSHPSILPTWAPPLPSWRTQGGKDMAKLSAHDCAVALLVKNTQPLHKVLVGALLLVTRDVLQDGQERLKVQHLGIHLFRWHREGKSDVSRNARGAEGQEGASPQLCLAGPVPGSSQGSAAATSGWGTQSVILEGTEPMGARQEAGSGTLYSVKGLR